MGSRRTGYRIPIRKHAQFGFRDNKLSNATVETDHSFGKNQDDRSINIRQSDKVDGKLPSEPAEIT
jgi:hypothetical protein